MKYILIPDIGFYSIDSVHIVSEGTRNEHKKVTAKSYECLLGQKYLDTFIINMGTVDSIDNVQFYNMSDPSKSLLHLVLEKCPDWSLGHIDVSIRTMQRSFEITKQDIYSFLTTDVSEAFGCVFLFDTIKNTINIYEEKNAGQDTDIYVSYNNLLKNTNFSCNINDIKTCLTLIGDDGLNIRDINMGYDKIYNLDYYNSVDYMSKSLYDAYNKWIKKRNDNLSEYTSLLSQFEYYYTLINELTNLKMPSNLNSTNWTEYGLIPLQEKLDAYEQQQSVMMKSGWGEPDDVNYTSKYLPVYNAINAIKSQLSKIETQLNNLKNSQSLIYSKMLTIIDTLSMSNNFTQEQLMELSAFIREDELSAKNFVVTDSMTDAEKFDMLHELLDYGEKELAKAATPQLAFDADMVNLFAIPEFRRFNGEFDVGNYIHVSIRDDYLVKARLLTMTVDFLDVTNFKVTFGNVSRQNGKLLDFTEVISMAQSAATSVSFNSSYWSKAAKDTSDIGKIIDAGLIAAGKYLKNGDDSEFIIDSRGIFVNTTSGQYANKDSIFIGGGRILFTDDSWKTVSMSVGRADVTIKGVTESRFGTFADFVIAGYIGGSILEGDEIIGGTLTSTNYVAGKTGTLIDLNKGTFEFNAGNEQKLTLDDNGVLTAKGTIKAELGYIGGQNGFVIMAGKLYSGKTFLTSNSDGVYIGTDGISLGANNVFKVTKDGTFYAEKGYIGGIQGFTLQPKKLYNGKSSISDTSNGIYLGTDGIALGANNVFKVTTDGTLVAERGYIGGENGFTIQTKKLYNGKQSISDMSDGVYIGTDGIALGANNVFKVTKDGTLVAEKGTIGDFTINKAIYNGKTSISSAQNGIYIGSDGIALGANNVFKVTTDGKLVAKDGEIANWTITQNAIYNNQPYTGEKNSRSTGIGTYGGNWAFWAGNGRYSVTQDGYFHAESGDIGGAVISHNSMHSENNNWWINSDGSASFRNVYITGVQDGSYFGSVGYNNGLTWGNFGGSSYFGSNISDPFSGTCVTHIENLAVGQITADRVRARALEAGFIDANTISARYIDVDELSAERANINTLIANEISAVNADINSIKSNYVKTSTLDAFTINANKINAANVNGHNVSWQGVDYVTSVDTNSLDVVTSVIFSEQHASKTSIRVVNEVHTSRLYTLCWRS